MATTQNTAPDPNLTDGMHIVVDALKKNGIDTMYGVVGIPVTDLARHAQEAGIRFIGFRHEQSAGYAASAAGFITKKPGILLTVSAPGFLNGLTALANATTNGFPLIQISGSSDRSIIDLQQGDYEELDQMNIAKPFAKASYRINKPEDIATGIARAIRAAVSGRPGGVYLDLTTALLGSVVDKDAADKTLFAPVDPSPASIPSPSSVERALKLIASAKQPLVILGKGAAYAQADDQIKNFIEKTGVPYIPMSMAKGLLPDNHPQSAASARGFVLENADVVILMGARLNWLLSHGKGKHWNPNVQFVQLDIDAMEFDSNRPIAAPVAGDISSIMDAFNAGLEKTPIKAADAWVKAVNDAKVPNDEKMKVKLNNTDLPMDYYSALNAVKKITDKYQDLYVINEGANTLDDCRNVIDMYKPRHRLDCGTWGVMGVGMGYAIGAAITSGQPVLAIEGDSAFGFDGMEIETMCRFKLPITVVIFNNGGIYNDSHVDLSGHGDPSPTTLMADAHYDKMIEAFGGTPYFVETPEELTKAIEAGVTSKKPTMINVVINRTCGTESGHIGSLNPKVISSK